MQTQQETKATLIEDEDTDELFKLIEKGERVVEVNMLTLTKLNIHCIPFLYP